MNWLTPFQFDFMLRAFGVGILVGTICALLSCFLILKGWSLMGDAVAHAVLPGIVLAWLAGLPLALGAFVSGLFCSVATGFIRENTRIKEDTAMGIVFTGLFALGMVMFSKIETDLHLNHILFGNLLGITQGDLAQTLVVGIVTFVAILFLRKDLLLFCFDASHARSIGLNTRWLYYALLSLLSATIVASLQAVGIILVIAMLIAPGCVARMLTDRFSTMLLLAVASAVVSSVVGIYGSFFINGDTAACIVLTQAFLFVLAMLFAPKHGLVAKKYAAQIALRSLVNPLKGTG